MKKYTLILLALLLLLATGIQLVSCSSGDEIDDGTYRGGDEYFVFRDGRLYITQREGKYEAVCDYDIKNGAFYLTVEEVFSRENVWAGIMSETDYLRAIRDRLVSTYDGMQFEKTEIGFSLAAKSFVAY